RLAVQLLRELTARAHEPANLVRDVDRKSDRPALVGQRARYCLADPPGRVRRKLVAELVVELLDRPDQAEVPLLDQVEQGDARLRVVARYRHYEPEVRLDQLLLRLLVALILSAGQLALLGGGQQRAVADRADVELQRILRGLGGLDGNRRVVVFLLVPLLRLLAGLLGDELEARLDRGVRRHVGKRPHAMSIGLAESALERFVNPRASDCVSKSPYRRFT